MSDDLTDGKPKPVTYRYRYRDPFSGNPVWRRDGELWNGQRPFETQPLYTQDAMQALEAENERLRDERDRAIEWRDHDKDRADAAENRLADAIKAGMKIATFTPIEEVTEAVYAALVDLKENDT